MSQLDALGGGRNLNSDILSPGDEGRVTAAQSLQREMATRRSIRSFSDQAVPKEVIRSALEIAVAAPSSANRQAWRFVAISDPDIRRTVRELAEAETRDFLHTHGHKSWMSGTNPYWRSSSRAHLEEAPWMIAVFDREPKDAEEVLRQHLMTRESACIATGFLVSALHLMGLGTLVHGPAASDYLEEVATDDEGERLALLVLVGHPREDEGETTPAFTPKKPFHSVASILAGDR